MHKLIAFRLSYNQIRQAEKRFCQGFCSPQKLGIHRIIYRGFVCFDFYGEHGETVNDLAMDEMAIENIRDEDYFLESCFLLPNEGESPKNKYQTFISFSIMTFAHYINYQTESSTRVIQQLRI